MDYQRIYNALIEKAQSRESVEGYTEVHHILPRVMGGSDDESNLVTLTYPEHLVSHHLLAKIYPNDRGMRLAWSLMSTYKQKLTGRSWLRSLELARSARLSETHDFYHQDHGYVTCTRIELETTYNIDSSLLCVMINGKINQAKGWMLAENATTDIILYNANHTITHPTKGTLTGTVNELNALVGGNIRAVIYGEQHTAFGWALGTEVKVVARNKTFRFANKDGREFEGTASDLRRHDPSIKTAGQTSNIKNGGSSKGWRLA